ncbi:homeobox-leucine zipper protein HAT22-like [Benincasa hispida]|uniref:homeobox-leucine zipper protein HAT22-like n=1 Tax=Benincasa hispida TaxID=102211 RepID=UPI001902041F|nr:homeobox-leucine zipper protein HAT22-like [Benincasa hispida]
MGLDDFSQTGLVLGLGLSNDQRLKKKPAPCSSSSLDFEPCALTLGFSGSGGHTHQKVIDVNNKMMMINNNSDVGVHHLHRQEASTHSSSAVCSSFSGGGRVKRERDLSSDEVELDRVSSRVSDEDEDGSNTRKKLRLSKQQSALLEQSFKQNSTLNPKQKQALARQLNLRPRQVEVWFQNRRARTKLKQTEVDCELLKKCCETLTDENRRLQKELQELKALKLAQPMYMQIPAATLTICPSCERVGGGGDGGASKPKFSMAPKPHFYNPFSNPSAAC